MIMVTDSNFTKPIKIASRNISPPVTFSVGEFRSGFKRQCGDMTSHNEKIENTIFVQTSLNIHKPSIDPNKGDSIGPEQIF